MYYSLEGETYEKIVFTGGGSAGHVTPNLAIIPHLQEQNWDISYIGSHQGVENDYRKGRHSVL